MNILVNVVYGGWPWYQYTTSISTIKIYTCMAPYWHWKEQWEENEWTEGHHPPQIEGIGGLGIFFAPKSIVVWFLFWFQKIPFWRQSMPPHFETQCCDEMILEGKPSWCFQIQNITKIYKFQGPLCVVVLRLGIYVSCTLNISYHTTPRFCEGRRVAYFEREKVGDKRKNSFFQTPRCHNLWCGMIWGNNGCESMVGDFAVQYDWTLF